MKCSVVAIYGDEAAYEVSRGEGRTRKSLEVFRVHPGLWVVSGKPAHNTRAGTSEHKTKGAAMQQARLRLAEET